MSRARTAGGAAGAALAALALLAAPVPARAQSEAMARGRAVFEDRCAACHSFDPARAASLPGPPLFGLEGRRAGAAAGFDFSPALGEAGRNGLAWTREALARYLDDPEQAVPGTFMSLRPFRDPADQAALLDYLLAATAPVR